MFKVVLSSDRHHWEKCFELIKVVSGFIGSQSEIFQLTTTCSGTSRFLCTVSILYNVGSNMFPPHKWRTILVFSPKTSKLLQKTSVHYVWLLHYLAYCITCNSFLALLIGDRAVVMPRYRLKIRWGGNIPFCLLAILRNAWNRKPNKFLYHLPRSKSSWGLRLTWWVPASPACAHRRATGAPFSRIRRIPSYTHTFSPISLTSRFSTAAASISAKDPNPEGADLRDRDLYVSGSHKPC